VWLVFLLQEKELSDYHASMDLVAMEEELDELSAEKQKLGTKLTQLQKELSQLSMYSSARGAIDGLKKQKKEKEDMYQLE
jgi:prefoldin subunit 5